MLFSKKPIQQKKAEFRSALASNKLLRFPGSFSALISMLVEQMGFDGIYISGGALANDLGLPDIGLTTLSEISQRGRAIARVTDLPAIIDIDTGFGEPMNVARTIQEMEERMHQILEDVLEYGCYPYMVYDEAGTATGGGAPPPSANGSDRASQYSETNVQVVGVDEADFVKNDGAYIYILADGKLQIIDAWPAPQTHIVSTREVVISRKTLGM